MSKENNSNVHISVHPILQSHFCIALCVHKDTGQFRNLTQIVAQRLMPTDSEIDRPIECSVIMLVFGLQVFLPQEVPHIRLGGHSLKSNQISCPSLGHRRPRGPRGAALPEASSLHKHHQTSLSSQCDCGAHADWK